MLDVTVVLLDDGLSSTAIMPVEIFHSAGALWNELHNEVAEPAFVSIANSKGRPADPARQCRSSSRQFWRVRRAIFQCRRIGGSSSVRKIRGKLKSGAWTSNGGSGSLIETRPGKPD